MLQPVTVRVAKTQGVTVAQAQTAPLNACRAAIVRQWPQGLWQDAFVTLHAENGLETPDRTGTINHDGSQDFGCLMINNHAHPGFFQNHDWKDADANAAEAYQIYLGRQRSQGNGWRAWYAVYNKLWR